MFLMIKIPSNTICLKTSLASTHSSLIVYNRSEPSLHQRIHNVYTQFILNTFDCLQMLECLYAISEHKVAINYANKLSYVCIKLHFV